MLLLVPLLLLLLLSCPSSAAGVQVGIMYEGWQAPAYFGRSLANDLTVEDVIRSNGSHSMANMSAGMNSKSMGFWWHKEPLDGFYCIYRKRSTEKVSSCGLPDCPNITQTLTRHATMLTSAGVDFIVADSTNIQSTGPTADALQLRPWDVVGEEWLELRKKGVSTPKIAIWQNLQDPKGNLWEVYVNSTYADPAYDDLIFKDEKSGKKVMFTTANPTAALVEKIEASGEIVVVTMWAERDNFAQGEWAFFSPCTAAAPEHPLKPRTFTTSIYSDPKQPCEQHLTTNSKIGRHGTSLTVGPSYQLSYSSLPYLAAGKLGGLTLKKQFEKAFAENAKGTLDYLQVGTFNEHIAQPQVNHFVAGGKPWVQSMGLEGDAFSEKLWVDMFGDGITRDLEPTKQDGGKMWALFESCMRVFHSGAASCDVKTEACCARGDDDPASNWVQVASLVQEQEQDYLLTTDMRERTALLSQGGWAEICSPVGGATAFCSYCTGAVAPNASAYHTGPFTIFAGSISAELSRPCHRCITPAASGGRHFVSASDTCLGLGRVESTLGYVSTSRSSDTARSLRLCQRPGRKQLRHSLDSVCDSGESQLEFLGFVH